MDSTIAILDSKTLNKKQSFQVTSFNSLRFTFASHSTYVSGENVTTEDDKHRPVTKKNDLPTGS